MRPGAAMIMVNICVRVITFGLRPMAEQLVGKKVDSPFFPGGPS
jgi:hypothetical protein